MYNTGFNYALTANEKHSAQTRPFGARGACVVQIVWCMHWEKSGIYGYKYIQAISPAGWERHQRKHCGFNAMREDERFIEIVR